MVEITEAQWQHYLKVIGDIEAHKLKEYPKGIVVYEEPHKESTKDRLKRMDETLLWLKQEINGLKELVAGSLEVLKRHGLIEILPGQTLVMKEKKKE